MDPELRTEKLRTSKTLAERDAQDIQEREERMTPQMPENVPGKNPRVLGRHLPSLQTTFGVRQAIVMNPNVSPRRFARLADRKQIKTARLKRTVRGTGDPSREKSRCRIDGRAQTQMAT